MALEHVGVIRGSILNWCGCSPFTHVLSLLDACPGLGGSDGAVGENREAMANTKFGGRKRGVLPQPNATESEPMGEGMNNAAGGASQLLLSRASWHHSPRGGILRRRSEAIKVRVVL
jgi:hypothetical protein